MFSNNKLAPSVPVTSTNVQQKIAYLTFDDGPSINTTKILDILDKYEIQATFFVVGPSEKLKNDLLIEILNRGHLIAIHSYDHHYSKIYKNIDSYLKDFYLCLNWIKDITGISPNLYRFPGGSSNTLASKEEIISIIEQLGNEGYFHVDWNVDSYDSYYDTDSNKIINIIINNIKFNEEKNMYEQTILFHDSKNKPATITSLPYIIEYLLSKGYVFMPLTKESNLIQHKKKPI